MLRLIKAIRLASLAMLLLGLGVSSTCASATTKATPKLKKTAAQKSTSTRRTTITKKSTQNVGSRKGKSTKRFSRRERGQKTPTSERISEIQTALAKDGSFTGTPNGKWDNNTVEAMKRFQAAHGLNASGKLEAKTLQKLGLGSQTAGLAAPTPAVKISANTEPQAPISSRQ